MRPPTMPEVLDQLRQVNPSMTITGEETAEGCWLRIVDGAWNWERNRLTSPGSALHFAQVALEGRNA